MWLFEGKLKVKTAHFQLSYVSQKRTCVRYLISCYKPRLLGPYCKLWIPVFFPYNLCPAHFTHGSEIEGEKTWSITYGMDLELGWP